jgi:hypothetical protein
MPCRGVEPRCRGFGIPEWTGGITSLSPLHGLDYDFTYRVEVLPILLLDSVDFPGYPAGVLFVGYDDILSRT